jgi:hypothetical protein
LRSPDNNRDALVLPGFTSITHAIADKLGVPRYAVIGAISGFFAFYFGFIKGEYRSADDWLKFVFFTGLAMALCAFADRKR